MKYRKKGIYQKITNQQRINLIRMVLDEKLPVKKVSSLLDLNYSTAKTILRIFRLEKRMLRKNKEESNINDSNLKSGNLLQLNKLSAVNKIKQQMDSYIFWISSKQRLSELIMRNNFIILFLYSICSKIL